MNEYAASLFGKYTFLGPVLAKHFSVFLLEKRNMNPFIRPNDFKITKEGSGIKGEVKKVTLMGSFYEIVAHVADHEIILHTTHTHLSKGDVLYVAL